MLGKETTTSRHSLVEKAVEIAKLKEEEEANQEETTYLNDVLKIIHNQFVMSEQTIKVAMDAKFSRARATSVAFVAPIHIDWG